jgi:predicted kinase
MPRLIHLNGPSGVGKSTLARRYAAEHPGTLALDMDVLVSLVGGWQDDFGAAADVARGFAEDMARQHIARGRDVVFPQLVTIYDAEPWGQVLAERAGADYTEVVLLAAPDQQRARLDRRRDIDAMGAYVHASLTRADGELMGRIRGHLAEYLADRPDALTIDTTLLDEDATYRRLLALVAAPAPSRDGREPADQAASR